MTGLKLNRAELQKQLKAKLEPHAFAGGAQLIEDLSHPGSGAHYEGNPNPSSVPGEFPAPQTGALMQSIDVRYQGNLTWAIGSFVDQDAEGFEHAVELESRPPEQGGRPFLEMELENPEFKRAILTGKGP